MKLPVRPECHMSEVPSLGSRTHAGRPLRRREGKWGSMSLPPQAHYRGANVTPWGGGVGISLQSTGPQRPARAAQLPRFPELPANLRKAPLGLSSSVAREAEFTEEMGYFLLVFFFFF